MNFYRYLLAGFVIFLSSVLYALEDPDKTLRVVTEHVYPIAFKDKNTGQIEGFATDYLKDILATADIEYSLDILPWARAYNMAKTQPNVLIYGLARTPSREPHFIWLTDFVTLKFFLYALKNKKHKHLEDTAPLKDRKIAVIRDDFNHHEMLANGFTNLVVAERHSNMSLLLQKGRADYFVASDDAIDTFGVVKEELYKAHPMDFLESSIYFALSQSTDPEIVASLRKAVEELKSDPDYTQPRLPYKPRVKSHAASK